MFTRAIIVAFLISCALSQHRFGCEEDFCAKKVKCPPFKCVSGSRIIENATTCGCCHWCVKALELDDHCDVESLSEIPTKECGPGLICDKKQSKCVYANTECMKDQKKYDELEYSKLPFGKTRPECDDFGYYKPVVCINDVLCYCVNKQGKRIFGTDVASKKDMMHCNCSRDFDEFPRSKSVDNFLRCLPNGNYGKLQCTGKWCYCMQDVSQGAGYIAKANTTLESLQCYDETLHNDYDPMLRSKCLQKRYKLQQEIKKYEDQTVTVIGVDLPECELDGSYAPVQCKNDRCYCVKKNGDKFGFSVSRKEAKGMNCRCVRGNELLRGEKNKNKNMKLFEKFQCLLNGNYKSTQNIGPVSITVSEMGYQILEND
ncbi:hypothetical protein JTE90_011600 [Oedothorax gibbosus]|uniref:Thyroglobulin type-1 domain-containing protein n=1 Tax=Oedothorax gibbosus TaxID=931172 RepID=A0AAV6U6R0_9ARAC|nr:hypothetical protein JTE90_011600 [Oedothorax gibbosus]